MFRSEKTHMLFSPDVYDESYKDLLVYSKQTPPIVKRAKAQIFTYYQGIDKNFLVTFLTPSGTTPGIYYYQKILLVEFKKFRDKWVATKKPIEIVRKAIQGSCEHPDGSPEESWLYWGHKYKATISGYNYGQGETRFPKIRNPKLAGGGCKHIRAVMAALPFHAGIITKDLIKLRVFESIV
jgi:hypothetical protein